MERFGAVLFTSQSALDDGVIPAMLDAQAEDKGARRVSEWEIDTMTGEEYARLYEPKATPEQTEGVIVVRGYCQAERID